MDFAVDITPSLEPAKDYIVAFGHLKLIRDRSNNEKTKSVPGEMKKSTTSRLPRNTHSSSKKNNPKFSGQPNISGDTAGTSKQTHPKIKLERTGEEKYKPSLIPRRKSSSKETPSREPSVSSIKSLPNRIKPNNTQQRNVQRVQLLNINPDFFRETHSPPKSVTSARPIPTLGHIYRQGISNDTFTDWFLESVDEFRETYNNAIDTTSTATDCSVTTCVSVHNNEVNNIKTVDITKFLPRENAPAPLKIFKTTNENVSEWLSTELDHPTRDNESGYRSMSPVSKISLNTTPKPVPCITNIETKKDIIVQNPVSTNQTKQKENVSGIFLSTAPTVVIQKKRSSDSLGLISAIPKINTDIKQPDFYPDFHKPLKYHSTPNPPRKREAIQKNPTASYVEYPSEVLQKTTNFETDGFDNLSSVIETGRRNISSDWTIRHNMDSNSTFNSTDWSKLQSSQGTLKKTSTSGSWRSNGFDDKNGTLTSEKYSYHDYCYHYCWRKEVAKKDVDEQSLWDCRGRCKRCHKKRRTPCEKKIGQPFRYLRKRMTIGICRHRLNRVWKKTTEKWANWSKSPSKLRRFRMMNYLQKSIIWDNANVQTTIFVYNETGTDAVAGEQKSAEITASLKLNSCRNDTPKMTDSVRTSTKHANIGPSMFPFLRYSSHDKAILGKTSNKSKLSYGNSDLNSRAKVNEIKNRNIECSNSHKNIFDGATSSVEHKVMRKMNDLTSTKLIHAMSQDAYTQVVIMCNNADTNIKFAPTTMNHPQKSPSLIQDLLYFGVDAETDPIIDKTQQRSIDVMTSIPMLQELTNIETQVSPSVSLRYISTGVLAKEMYQDAKSSVITDTTIPCRRLDNTLITSKGTILSCTGTKVTSVSSADIQTPSTISKILNLKPFTVNTAVSAFVRTKHMDCSTAPSLCWPEFEDVSLETDAIEVMKSEKSTSQSHLQNYLDVGVSPRVVERASFKCGSHQTQSSFGATIQPDHQSVVINTDVEAVSDCTSMLDSDQRSIGNKVIDNCQTQCSSYMRNGSWSPDTCARMRIGRSRLLSVRALLPDANDNEVQAQPSILSAETKTTSNQKMSASVLTSRYAFGDRLQPREMNLEAEHVLTLNRAQVRSENETGSEPCHDNLPAVITKVSSKRSQRSKHPSVFSNKQRLRTKSRSPSFVISSNLNASKWINESANENKNVNSILTASACAVSESLEQATLVASSSDKLTPPEIHQLSKVLINSQPTVNCVSSKSYGHVSSTSFSKKLSVTMNSANTPDLNKTKSPTLTADKVTSDEVVVKDVRETELQVRPDLCDTAPALPIQCATKSSSKFSVVLKLDRICDTTECDILDHKSVSVLTSRHVLPKNSCCGVKTDGSNDIDCLFVYDRPRCVIHSYLADVAVQIYPSQKEKVHTKNSSSQRSIGVATSLPCQNCCHQKNNLNSDVLPPRVYKALYDTTKHILKEGVSRHSSESTSDKGENEVNKVTSQMTSCLGIASAQCCCIRCIQMEHTDNRSIQAVQNSFLHCPNCAAILKELEKVDSDTTEDCVRSHLATSCRYYSNLLTMKLGRVKDNFIRHLVPSVEDSIYPVVVPDFYAEACTMKPSGKQNQNCEAKINNTHSIYNTLNSSCSLSLAMSATDLRGQEKEDLKTVYYMLSAIEGRVRRLKSNLER